MRVCALGGERARRGGAGPGTCARIRQACYCKPNVRLVSSISISAAKPSPSRTAWVRVPAGATAQAPLTASIAMSVHEANVCCTAARQAAPGGRRPRGRRRRQRRHARPSRVVVSKNQQTNNLCQLDRQQNHNSGSGLHGSIQWLNTVALAYAADSLPSAHRAGPRSSTSRHGCTHRRASLQAHTRSDRPGPC